MIFKVRGYMYQNLAVTAVTAVTTGTAQACEFVKKAPVTTGDSGDNFSGDKITFCGDKMAFCGDRAVTGLSLAVYIRMKMKENKSYLIYRDLASNNNRCLSPLSPLL